MPEKCPVCGFRYEVELGFYWGVLYMSYALSFIIVLIGGLALYHLANDPPTWIYLTVVSSIIVVSTPISFRYGRMLMLYLFGSVSFDPNFFIRNQGK